MKQYLTFVQDILIKQHNNIKKHFNILNKINNKLKKVGGHLQSMDHFFKQIVKYVFVLKINPVIKLSIVIIVILVFIRVVMELLRLIKKMILFVMHVYI